MQTEPPLPPYRPRAETWWRWLAIAEMNTDDEERRAGARLDHTTWNQKPRSPSSVPSGTPAGILEDLGSGCFTSIQEIQVIAPISVPLTCVLACYDHTTLPIDCTWGTWYPIRDSVDLQNHTHYHSRRNRAVAPRYCSNTHSRRHTSLVENSSKLPERTICDKIDVIHNFPPPFGAAGSCVVNCATIWWDATNKFSENTTKNQQTDQGAISSKHHVQQQPTGTPDERRSGRRTTARCTANRTLVSHPSAHHKSGCQRAEGEACDTQGQRWELGYAHACQQRGGQDVEHLRREKTSYRAAM